MHWIVAGASLTYPRVDDLRTFVAASPMRRRGGRFYGTEAWNPKRILTQICAVQALFYGCLVAVLKMIQFAFGLPSVTEIVLAPAAVSVSSSTGWAVIIALATTAITVAFGLSFIIERVKKCLDFSFTAYFLHTVACSVYETFPTTLEWWLVTGVCFGVTTLFGEYFCLRRERQEIPVEDFHRRPPPPPMPAGTIRRIASASEPTLPALQHDPEAGGDSLPLLPPPPSSSTFPSP